MTWLPKEQGSFFHSDESVFSAKSVCFSQSSLHVSGRQALAKILSSVLINTVNRLYLPSYYCHEVTDYISALVDVRFYECSPISDRADIMLSNDEAVVVVEYFGAKSGVSVTGGKVLLDRTHDPFADFKYRRDPDFVFGSLRKIAPLPDGGFVTPAIVGVGRHDAASNGSDKNVSGVLEAMRKKADYLSGEKLDKSIYLKLYAAFEEQLGGLPLSTEISNYSEKRINALDRERLCKAKTQNLKMLKEFLAPEIMPFEFLNFPSFAVLKFGSQGARDAFREKLTGLEIYSAMLWPRNKQFQKDIEFLATHLVLHIDYRVEGAISHLASCLIDTARSISMDAENFLRISGERKR